MGYIRNRLKLLSRHQGTIHSVCRKLLPEEIGAKNPKPLALVHDDQTQGGWHETAVVCGGFSNPPPRMPRTLAKGQRNKAVQSDFFQAVYKGVPFLVWPEEPTPASDVETHLSNQKQPSRLCLYFEQSKFVVLAESIEPPVPDSPSMFSDVKSFT